MLSYQTLPESFEKHNRNYRGLKMTEIWIKQLYRIAKKLNKYGVGVHLFCLEHHTPILALPGDNFYCRQCKAEVFLKEKN